METKRVISDDFDFLQEGPLYVWLKKTRHFNSYWRIAVLALCIAWVPLVIICAFEGTLFSGVEIPFLFDAAMQARVLIALPILIAIKGVIDREFKSVAKFISNKLLDVEERNQIIHTTLPKVRQLSSSNLTKIIMLLIVIASTVSMVKGKRYSTLDSEKTSWMAVVDGDQKLSVAGYWAVIVSIPICQYLLLRWLGYYIVWIILLFCFSKANISLFPTHADKAGGLGIIMIAQRIFNLFFIAVGIILSGELTADLLNHPDQFNVIKLEALGFIIICLILLIFPLVFFSGKLYRLKTQGLLDLNNLSRNISRKFESEWVNDLPMDIVLQQPKVDPSMVTDYSTVFGSLQEIKVLPVRMQDIVGLTLTLFLPFVPIIFIQFSMAEMLQKIAGIFI